jgi:hypothetical protein
MMNRNIGSLFFASVLIHGLESSHAFQFHRGTSNPSRIFAETDADPIHDLNTDVDLALVEHCANNFGKYSMDEIEQCRDELHSRRVQNVALVGGEISPDIMKEKFLEEELTSQLNWLKKEMPNSYLFPDEEILDADIESESNIDGLLMDNGLVAVDLPPRLDAEPSSEAIIENKNNVMWKELAKEGVLESVAICIFLGFMIVGPNIF